MLCVCVCMCVSVVVIFGGVAGGGDQRCHCLASGGFIKTQCPEVKSHSSPLLWSGSSGLRPSLPHLLHPHLSHSILPSLFPLLSLHFSYILSHLSSVSLFISAFFISFHHFLVKKKKKFYEFSKKTKNEKQVQRRGQEQCLMSFRWTGLSNESFTILLWDELIFCFFFALFFFASVHIN